MDDAARVLDYLQQVEALAEDVLATKQHIVELSKKKNSNREALAALATCNKPHGKPLYPCRSRDKAWVNMGGMFIKLTTKETQNIIRSDQQLLETEIEQSRDSLQDKVNALNDAQGKPPVQGFGLQPLSKDELSKIVY